MDDTATQWFAIVFTVAVGVLTGRWIRDQKSSRDHVLIAVVFACGLSFVAGIISQSSVHRAERQRDFDRYCECAKSGSCRCYYPAPGEDPATEPPDIQEPSATYRGM